MAEERDVSLIAFARLPVAGKVKTRLAAGSSDQVACEFYGACLLHCLQAALKCVKRTRPQYKLYENAVFVKQFLNHHLDSNLAPRLSHSTCIWCRSGRKVSCCCTEESEVPLMQEWLTSHGLVCFLTTQYLTCEADCTITSVPC